MARGQLGSRVVAVTVLMVASMASGSASAGSAPGGVAARTATATPVTVPLAVTPSTDLVDGQTVSITAPAGYGQGSDAGLFYVLCPAASTDLDACSFLDDSTSGQATLQVSVPARILAGDGVGTITATDCRTAACAIRAIAYGEVIRAAGSGSSNANAAEAGVPASGIVAEAPVTFDPHAPLRPAPSLTVTPASGLTDGQAVQVTVTVPDADVSSDGPDVFVAQCASPIDSLADIETVYDRCALTEPIDFVASGGGSFRGTATLSAYIETRNGPIDCRATGSACAIVAIDRIGQTDNVALGFDPDGHVNPRILQRPLDASSEDFHMVLDIVGLTPGDPFTVKWCNQDHACLAQVVASGTLDSRGVGTFTFSDDAFPDVADDDTTCADMCLLTAMDAHGLVASSEFGIGIGPVPPVPPFSSVRHPVTVTPHRGLHDGDTVTVTATGYRPGASIAIVECLGAALDEGAGACDLDTSTVMRGQTVTADAQGNVSATYEIERNLHIGDSSFDCRNGNIDPDEYVEGIAADPSRVSTLQGGDYTTCIVAVADLSDYSESGGTPIAFDGARFKKLPWEHDALPRDRTATAATPVKAQPSFTG